MDNTNRCINTIDFIHNWCLNCRGLYTGGAGMKTQKQMQAELERVLNEELDSWNAPSNAASQKIWNELRNGNIRRTADQYILAGLRIALPAYLKTVKVKDEHELQKSRRALRELPKLIRTRIQPELRSTLQGIIPGMAGGRPGITPTKKAEVAAYLRAKADIHQDKKFAVYSAAEEFGISKETVYKIAREFQVDFPRIPQLRKLRAASKSAQEGPS